MRRHSTTAHCVWRSRYGLLLWVAGVLALLTYIVRPFHMYELDDLEPTRHSTPLRGDTTKGQANDAEAAAEVAGSAYASRVSHAEAMQRHYLGAASARDATRSAVLDVSETFFAQQQVPSSGGAQQSRQPSFVFAVVAASGEERSACAMQHGGGRHFRLAHIAIGFGRAASESSSVPDWYSRRCAGYNSMHFKSLDTLEVSTDSTVNTVLREMFGPDWFEATVVDEAASTSVFFVYDRARCLYISSRPVLLPLVENSGGQSSVVVLVDHLHESWNAFRETQEEAHFDYRLERLQPAIASRTPETSSPRADLFWIVSSVSLDASLGVWKVGSDVAQLKAEHLQQCNATSMSYQQCVAALSGQRWEAVRRDPITQYGNSVLKGYWLTYKTMRWSDYDVVPNYRLDYLGRMNFGYEYRWRPDVVLRVDAAERDARTESGGCLTTVNGKPAVNKMRSRDGILESLRNRVIYFFGDSHMRIFFYGFLSRLGIAYPLDKVWRGDRTDFIASHNATVSFIASYFLNFSRPSAEGMMTDQSSPVIVAGVGQHHSCHCWSVHKHMEVVRGALRDLTSCSPLRQGLAGNTPLAWAQPRDVVWFGIPAQPFNTHLYRRKPIGQSRRDCRNNGRHLLYSAYHHEAVSHARSALSAVHHDAGRCTLNFVDAFQRSMGMQHTSLDGAHYYTWVREAWIDDLADILSRLPRRGH